MKRIVFLILGVLFMLLGVIGLIIPIVPQVPFFAAGLVFLVSGSARFRKWLTSTGVYKKYLYPHVQRHKILRDIMEKA